MLSKIFQKLYNKIFVNIIVHDRQSTVYIETVNKNGKILTSIEEKFNTYTINEELKNFIQNAIVESPYFYISILDKSTLQGALPTVNKNDYPKYIDIINYKIHPMNNNWSSYSEKGGIYRTEKDYETLKLDFIFSPFILLHNFFEDKLNLPIAMFLLVEKGFISLSIYSYEKLLYSEHLDLKSYEDSNELLIYEDENFTEDNEIELDDIDDLDSISDIEDIDLFDDFGDIEDLDSIDDIDEFSESKDIEEELLEEELVEEVVHNEADGFNEDYQRFLLIQTSLNKFYKDELYESEFIESVYIADGIGVSHDLKRFLEEEMFLSVYIRKIDLALSLCEVAKEELSV